MVRPVVAVSETALHYHGRSTTTAHSAGFLVGNGNALLSLCAAAGWRKKCSLRHSHIHGPSSSISYLFQIWLLAERVKITSSTLYFTALQFHHKQKTLLSEHSEASCCCVWDFCALPQPQCYHGALFWLLGLALECTFVLVYSSMSPKNVLLHNSNFFPEFS